MKPVRHKLGRLPLAKAKSHPSELDLKRLAPRIDAVARRVFRQTGCVVELDDLTAAGWLGVAATMEAHDPAISPFDSYACQRARWAMYDLVRRTVRRVSVQRGVPECAAKSVQNGHRRIGHRNYEEPMVDTQMRLANFSGRVVACGDVDELAVADENPEDAASKGRRADRIRDAVARLPQRERTVVERHYFDGDRLNRIARDMSLSQYAVSRAHRRAIHRLERALASELEAA